MSRKLHIESPLALQKRSLRRAANASNAVIVSAGAELTFARDDFAAGDRVRVIGWKHIRGAPMMWPRAIQVNDGPMRSNLRFTDMIDIANGVFEEMNIVPAANLNGSPSVRAGTDAVRKLDAMGLLDDEGRMIWPAP